MSLLQLVDRLSARRLPEREAGPVQLHYRRIYILPTRNSVLFGLVLLVMLLSAINYSNSMGFMLTFLLGSLFVLAMLQAHNNLLGLHVSCLGAPPVFAGQTARLALLLDNPGRRPRSDIHISNDDGEHTLVDSIDARQQARAELKLATRRRGRHAVGRLRLASGYPLGLTRAWCWWRPDCHYLVYPAPESHAPPPRLAGGQGASGPRGGEGEDFAGLRDYRPGDPLSRLHWRRLSTDGMPHVKTFAGQAERGDMLTWDSVRSLRDTEARLSRLCAWVLDCDARGIRYGLELPGTRILPDQGPAQRQRCLEALALYPEGRT